MTPEGQIIKEKTIKQKEKKKSLTKAAGVKSVFVKGDKIIMTSFGKGAKAIVEKQISMGEVTDIHDPAVFNVEVKEHTLDVEGNNFVVAKPENPFPPVMSKRKIKQEKYEERLRLEGKKVTVKRGVGVDQIFAKDDLELQFFGQTFNDNIKIQIIYNILDINKILVPFVNDIVYSINNLYRDHDVNNDDVGSMKYDIPHDKYNPKRNNFFAKFYENAKPYLGYYPNIFMNIENQKNCDNIKATLKSEVEIYNILRIISGIRQSLVHEKDKAFVLELKNFDDDLKATIDNFYSKKIDEVNKNFYKQNMKTNFNILDVIFKLDKSDNRNSIYQCFYNLIIKGENKNLGFSIKKIREELLKLPDYASITSKQHDDHRSKLNRFIDFIIFMYYKNEGKNETDEIINKLRSSITDCDKQNVYNDLAVKLSSILHTIILDRLLPLMNGKILSKIKEESESIEIKVPKIALIDVEATYFTKIIYFISLFLDGKDSNILLSTLINKFENIQAFLELEGIKEKSKFDTLLSKFNSYKPKDANAYNAFSKGYEMFLESRRISEELHFVKAITKMDFKAVPKEAMFLDAAYLLGYDGSDDRKKDQKEISKLLKLSDKSSAGKMGFRNFIINNVIESRNFIYLMRHVNPQNVKMVSRNKELVKFVLNRVPESQLRKNYVSVTCLDDQATKLEMVDKLVKKITSLKFSDFKGINNKEKTIDGSSDKEKSKALIGLYLRVLYRIYKNMIAINSRYVTALHVLERDYVIKFKCDSNDFKGLSEQKRLSKHFMNKSYLKPRQIAILEGNLAELDNGVIFKEYRNQIVHLNSIRNLDVNISGLSYFSSYFSIYHYISQRALVAKNVNGNLIDRIKQYCSKGTYCKDALHILHSPFGYNQARYKNLSIEDLFDMNKDDIIE